MQYSFTEKKRIRKSFAKRTNRSPSSFLLATQLESFSTFLQADTAAPTASRKACKRRSRPFSRSFRTMVLRDSNSCSYMLSPAGIRCHRNASNVA